LSFSTYALNLALKESKDTEVSYFAIPVSYEMKDFIKVEDGVDKLLKKGGYTKFVSEYVNEEKGIFIQIFIGKFQKSSENRVLFAINSEDLELFKQKEKTFHRRKSTLYIRSYKARAAINAKKNVVLLDLQRTR